MPVVIICSNRYRSASKERLENFVFHVPNLVVLLSWEVKNGVEYSFSVHVAAYFDSLSCIMLL